MRLRPGRRAAGVLWALAAAGCGKGPSTDAPPPAPPPASASAPLPVDRVLPGELGEGTEKVLGLTLPRGFHVVRQFAGATFAEGPAGAEQTANYLRRRIVASTVEVGASLTIFQAARIKDAPGSPLVRIEVASSYNGSQIVVRDLTPPPVEPGLSEEERWRKNGLKPNGDLLDPNATFLAPTTAASGA